MPNQEESPDGIPRKDKDRPSPDVKPTGTGPSGKPSGSSPDVPPAAGGTLNFDDDDMAHPRGDTSRTGGTWEEAGKGRRPSDAGELGPPSAGLSNTNGPSDPDR